MRSLASVVAMSPSVQAKGYVLYCHSTLGPHKTEHLLTFLGGLWDFLFERKKQDQCIPSMSWFGTMSAFTVASGCASASTSTSNS